MAITSNRYTGDGTTTRFAVTFAQYSWTSIVVYLDQVEQTTGYAYDSATKEIVFTSAPIVGAKVTLKRLTDAELLYKFGEGAAFTGSNIDSNFEQYQTAVEEVQNAADADFVNDALESEIAERQAADASLQSQITSATPILANEMSVVTWHGQRIENSVVIPDNMNAFSVGPQITIAPGQSVTIGEGSAWNVLGNAFEIDELYNVTANNLTTSDGSFTIAVDNIAALDVQTAHGTAITTNADAIAALGVRMTAEEGKTQPITLGGTGAATADGALTALGGGTTGIAVFKGASASAVRSTLSAAASGANTDITSLQGTTAGTNAATGKVGEVLSATGTLTSYTTATQVNLVSLSLTAGDWEVDGVALFDITGGSTAVTMCGITTTSATVPAFPDRTTKGGSDSYDVNSRCRKRINVSSTTTIYLAAYAEVASGTLQVNGYLEARRVR